MTLWNPEWKLTINGGGDYTNVTLANLTITSGRTDIYSQATAGYCAVTIINNEQQPILIDINDQVSIQIKDSTGTYVHLFGGYVTDVSLEVKTAMSGSMTQTINVLALGALSKLPKTLTEGVLSKDFEGDQIYSILSGLLFNTWNEVPASTTWATYNPATTWADAENSGLGNVDQPGDYELTARSASTIDVYSLVSGLATSGLGYLYEDAQGRIGYADSTHRNSYFAANGYVELSGNHALARGIRTIKKSGDVRNSVTITYKNGLQVSATDANSIALYGPQAYEITTSLENNADAEFQADFYLGLRAYPQAQFQSITFPLASPEIDDSDRDALLNVFMGMPVKINDLPINMENGTFGGFVEGWTLNAGFNSLNITLNISPLAYSIQAVKWEGVGGTETWQTINTSLDWENATIVA